MNIEQYAAIISDKEDDLLADLRRETYRKTIMPRMISGHLQGLLLKFVSKMIKPSKILEIGTFTGYSTLCLAEGLSENGQIITIEKNDELAFISQKYFNKSKFSKKIIQIFDDALEVIDKLNDYFDLVFIDGDKREYPEYYNKILPKVKNGGYILIDNIFWYNKVIDDKADQDAYTRGIIKMTDLIKNDKRVEKLALPIRDGLYLIRKK